MNNIYDPVVYNNCVLTDNITKLTTLYYQTFQLQQEAQQYRDTISKLNEELETTKHKLQQSQIMIAMKEILKKGDNNMDYEQNNVKPKYSEYKIIMHRQHKNSWSDDKVKEKLSSINSIYDIIMLDGYWNNLKHNIILQKLYFVIPPLKKLNSMVGMKNIKEDVFKKIIYHIMNGEEKEDYLNTIISGPPGVGKTEFAKIYGEIFLKLGILKNNKFIEVKRDDLVGQYLGHTAHKTRELLKKADGGVLFLDEAYSLGSSDKRDSYSKEAIDMINQYLSERKGKFMFIIAGYEDDLESCLFGYNKGLQRRFHSHYKIKGYEPNELKDIFITMIEKTKFKVNVDTNLLIDFFTKNKNNFINYAGDVEKLLNEVKQVQSLRSFNIGNMTKEIILEDIIKALHILDKEETNMPPHGMYL
jgi:stage V sporulation protein K